MAAWINELLGVFSPKAAYQRRVWEQANRAMKDLQRRGYDAARRDRFTDDWAASSGSGNVQLIPDLGLLRARARQMVRDNTYAKATLNNLVTNLVGDGIRARAQHSDPKIAKMAQDYWDRWARSKVDGRNNYFTVQKLAVQGMIEGGDTLLLWKDYKDKPNVRVKVLDGDYLYTALTTEIGAKVADGALVIAGVEFDGEGDRIAYHLYNRHPGDFLPGLAFKIDRIDARYVDHVFDPMWGDQVRGVPWFHAGMRKMRDVDQLEEALRIKKRVEACLAVFRTPGPDDDPSPIGQQTTETKDNVTRTIESLSPGMVVTGQPGEKIEVVNPSSGGDGDSLHRRELMAVAASFGVPYHVMTGDVSAANYSSLRAGIVVFYALLDAWLAHAIVPTICDPAFVRTMQRAALELDEPELLNVTAHWTSPPRPWVDPLKDVTAQIMEIRAGLSNLPKALAARGIDWRREFAEDYQVNKLIDLYGLAFDTDPRRLNQLGVIQPPAGWVNPRPGAEDAATETEGDQTDRALHLIACSAMAEEDGDAAAAEQLLLRAVTIIRETGRLPAAA